MAAINFKSGLSLAPYAIGNAVPGGRSSVEGVSPEMARRVAGMVEAMPPEVAARFKIISGFRDAARQAEVNPGVTHSRHTGTGAPGSGMALDLANDPVVLNWINAHPEHGLGFPLKHMRNEQNHMEMMDKGLRAPITGGPPPFKPMAVPSPDAEPPAPDVPATPVTVPPPDPAALAAAGNQRGQGAADFAKLSEQYKALAAMQAQGSLSDAIANLVKATQAPASAPEPILQNTANLAGPIPLSRQLR